MAYASEEVMMLPSHVEALLRTKAASKYWRESDAQVVLAAMSDSGMPLTAFCAHFGIRVEKLRRWRRRLGESVEIGFHEVRLVEPLVTVDGGSADPMFDVMVRGGRIVKVPARFDSAGSPAPYSWAPKPLRKRPSRPQTTGFMPRVAPGQNPRNTPTGCNNRAADGRGGDLGGHSAARVIGLAALWWANSQPNTQDQQIGPPSRVPSGSRPCRGSLL